MIAVAAKDFERPLIEELGQRLVQQYGRLLEFTGGALPNWSRNIWLEPVQVKFQSISEAAKILRSVQRNWWLHPTAAHRRASLIEEQLPPIRFSPREFPTQLPTAPLGSWTLLDEHTLLYSAQCSSLFPDGEIEFKENKVDPPSRAYLKLWEVFTLEQLVPQPGAKVLDLGSSPGGWTWVLDQLGCEVISVDKAPLVESLRVSSRVKFVAESAFALDPKAVGKVDWLFSDVICYPERLLELVKKWYKAQPTLNFVCTLKFQGPTKHKIVDEFLALPKARLRFLSANKHELTLLLFR